MLRLDLSVIKTNKYASSESGDTVEVVERAKGGVSIIMADGQGSGKSAKLTSNLVVTKAMNLLAEGARDGAVARAAHDFLYTVKNGKVSATLTIVSIDLESKSIIISRNGHIPVLISKENHDEIFAQRTDPIGVHRFMKPEINEISIEKGMTIVAFTDGFLDAGERYDQKLNLDAVWNVMKEKGRTAKDKASQLFDLAMELDKKRPNDDTTILVVHIMEDNHNVPVRSLNMSIPI